MGARREFNHSYGIMWIISLGDGVGGDGGFNLGSQYGVGSMNDRKMDSPEQEVRILVLKRFSFKPTGAAS